MPTGGREISQPFERALDHQLRLAGAQSHRVHSQITILGVVTVRCAQLDQLDAARDGFLDPPQQGRGFQILRGDQVLLGQTGSGDDRSIGLRKLVIRELTGGHPGQRLTFGTMRFAGERRDFPNIQQYLLVRVVVLNLDQRSRDVDDNAQFFVKLATKSRFNGLVSFDLATREFPQPTLMLGVGTASDEDLAAAITDNGGGYVYSFHRLISSSPAFCQALKAGHW